MCFLCSVNVLIIHQHFRLPQEGGAIRSYYLATSLAKRGIRVHVITATRARHYSLKVIEGMNVHYLPIAYDNKFGFWRRGSAFLKFAWSAASLSSKLPGLDLCYAISVPLTTGLTAMWLKRNRGLPYIFEVGDLWPDAPIALGFVKDRMLQSLLKRLERQIYVGSTAVVALSEPIRESILEKVPGKKVFVIPNMSDIAFYGSGAAGNDLRIRHGLREKFIISYIGAVGFANGLDHLIECARSAMQARVNVHFFICGEGAMLNQHKVNAQRLQLTNLTFLPFMNRDGVREVMDATDAIFVSYKPFRILETGSPNKYFDGLAAGKLILLNFEGWIKEEVERESCGVYIDRQHPEKFAEIIAPFIQDTSLLQKYQLRAKGLALRQYARELLTDNFVSLIQSQVATR